MSISDNAVIARLWQHIIAKVGVKADTEALENGDIVVAEATHALRADTATSATSATQDASGNVITDTYETKDAANAKLIEVKAYTNTAEIDAVNTANAYTDDKISTARDEVIESSNNYTDTKVSEALTEAKSYTDTAEIDAVNTAKIYTDEQITAIETTVSTTYASKSEIETLETEFNARIPSIQMITWEESD